MSLDHALLDDTPIEINFDGPFGSVAYSVPWVCAREEWIRKHFGDEAVEAAESSLKSTGNWHYNSSALRLHFEIAQRSLKQCL